MVGHTAVGGLGLIQREHAAPAMHQLAPGSCTKTVADSVVKCLRRCTTCTALHLYRTDDRFYSPQG